MDRKTSRVLLAIGLAILLIAPVAMAQQQYVFPQKGQTPDQQKKDEYECHTWAVKQTGFDPTAAAQAPAQQAAQQPAGAQPGSGARGAARGAVVGAAVGSLDGEAGKGAAAVPGASAGISATEHETTGLSPGEGCLPRGERLLGEMREERMSRIGGVCSLRGLHREIKNREVFHNRVLTPTSSNGMGPVFFFV